VRAFLVGLVAALALAAGAAAKDGVVAHLENPVALSYPPGAKITLVWTLRAGKKPFSAGGIYVRLNGGRENLSTEIATGRFRARLTIPRGGVRSIVIAVPGWASTPTGTHRADWRLPIVNDPTR
jgi:hypothetical protein